MFNHLHYTFNWLRWSKPKGEPRSIPKGLERHWVDTASGRLEILAAVPDQRTDGPPLFFVHGSMGSAWIWSDYMRFCAIEYGIPCYALSLRGHGESWHPSFLRLAYGTTRSMMADDLVAGIQWAEKLEGQEVMLVGHSNGGGLSQDILSQGRVAVRGLALLGAIPATGIYQVVKDWTRLDPWFSLRMVMHGWHPNSPLSHPTLIRRAFFAGDVSDDYLLEFQARGSRYESFWWPLTMLRQYAEPERILRQVENESSTGSKMLLMTGTEDKLVTPATTVRLGGVYRAAAERIWAEKTPEGTIEVVMVDKAGHHLQNDTVWLDGAKVLAEFHGKVSS